MESVPFLSAGDGVLGCLGSSARPPKTRASDGGFDAGKTTAAVRANDVTVVASSAASTAAVGGRKTNLIDDIILLLR
ncbi:unnamed protein product [Linum trigynum]|uniref:Uncharacterized protein n=1 Tax=Linum trigynum TaxID=586398 RepID=A0AAV2FCH4_9ROSI